MNTSVQNVLEQINAKIAHLQKLKDDLTAYFAAPPAALPIALGAPQFVERRATMGCSANGKSRNGTRSESVPVPGRRQGRLGKSDLMKSIVLALKGPFSNEDAIAALLNAECKISNVTALLTRLLNEGLVKKIKIGTWEVCQAEDYESTKKSLGVAIPPKDD